MVSASWEKLRGTSSETTSRVRANPKTASEKPSRRETSPPRQRKSLSTRPSFIRVSRITPPRILAPRAGKPSLLVTDGEDFAQDDLRGGRGRHRDHRARQPHELGHEGDGEGGDERVDVHGAAGDDRAPGGSFPLARGGEG